MPLIQVFKRVAGLDVDRMAGYLFELEYLQSDDLTELEEKLRLAISGVSVWSAQKSEYDYDMEGAYMAAFGAPQDDELPEEISTLTALEEDTWGDIIAYLMGDAEETEEEPDDLYELPENSKIRVELENQGRTSTDSHELPATAQTPQGERFKLEEWADKYRLDNPLRMFMSKKEARDYCRNNLLPAGREIIPRSTPYPAFRGHVSIEAVNAHVITDEDDECKGCMHIEYCEHDAISRICHELPARTTRSEWIRTRLASLPPGSIETVKRIVTGTLENMERKRGIDLTAEKRDVSDA